MGFGRQTSYLDPEEDDQLPDYSGYTPQPDDSSPMGGSGGGTFSDVTAASAPAALKSPAQLAREKVAELTAARPDRPKVSLLRNLAAIGVGFGGAYANAAGKGLPQVNIGDAVEGIRYGGYDRKVADWEKQVGDADVAAKNLTEGENLGQTSARNSSLADEAKARTGLYNAQTDQIVGGDKNPFISVPQGAGVFDKRSGSFVVDPSARAASLPKTFEAAAVAGFTTAHSRPPTDAEAATMKRSFERIPPDKLDHTTVSLIAAGWDPESGEKPTTEQSKMALKLGAEGSPLTALLAEMTQQRFETTKATDIETRKQNALSKAEADYTKRKNDLAGDPASADAWLAGEKQRIQNAYLSEIQAAKGPGAPPLDSVQRPGGPVPAGVPPPVQGGGQARPQPAGPAVPPPPVGRVQPAVALPPPTDPKLKAYADQFFNGDVNAALAHIAQRGKK